MRQGDWRYVESTRVHWTDRVLPYLPMADAVLRVGFFALLLWLCVSTWGRIAGLQTTIDAVAFEGVACPANLQ